MNMCHAQLLSRSLLAMPRDLGLNSGHRNPEEAGRKKRQRFCEGGCKEHCEAIGA